MQRLRVHLEGTDEVPRTRVIVHNNTGGSRAVHVKREC